LEAYLREFFDQTQERHVIAKNKRGKYVPVARYSDYIALMAYLTRSPASEKAFAEIRLALRSHYRAATTLGYGPRFLHSTGQLHKGGANNGIFVQITAPDLKDLKIPGEEYTFGVLKEAQAIGDLQALKNHNRRAIRLHLADAAALDELQHVINAALSAGPAEGDGSKQPTAPRARATKSATGAPKSGKRARGTGSARRAKTAGKVSARRTSARSSKK
jgi:hypothetical protein